MKKNPLKPISGTNKTPVKSNVASRNGVKKWEYKWNEIES